MTALTPAERKRTQRERARQWLKQYGVTTAEALVTKLMAGEYTLTRPAAEKAKTK